MGGLVGGILGAIGGSQKSPDKVQTTTQAPWGPQQPYILEGFKQARDIMDTRMANPLPEGPWVAPTNDKQTAASDALFQAGMSAPGNFAQWSGVGNTLAAGAPQFLSTASDISSNGISGPNPSMTNLLQRYALTGQMPGGTQADPRLSRTVTSAATGALPSLSAAQSTAGSVATRALDPQNGINAALTGAEATSNDPTLQGQIDAASRDVVRNLNENDIRGLRQAALATGNANSSRQAALEAIATRGAADRIGDIASTLRGAAYNHGLDLGAGLYSSGLSTANGSASVLNTNGGLGGSLAGNELNRQTGQSQFNVNSRLGAVNSNNATDLGFQTADTTARLGGNSQLGAGLTTGINASGAGLQGQIEGIKAALAAGTFDQAQADRMIQDTINRWQAGDTRNQGILNDYWNIVGRPLGQESVQTIKGTGGGLMGALQGAVGGFMGGTGFAKNLGSDSPMFGGLFGGGGGSLGGFADAPFDLIPV